MLDGQWNMQFITPYRKIDAGVINISDNKFCGGDSNYRYLGEVDLSEGVLAGELRAVSNHIGPSSIFGRLDQFRILLCGKVLSSSMDLTGYLAENPMVKIRIECTKVG
jgi:hypothetical protein